MMIKRILTAGLALLCAAGGLSAQEQTVDGAFGGVYRKVVKPDEGEMAREGQIVVIFSEKGVWFNAFLARADGHTAALKPEGGTWFEKTGEGRDFSYNWVDDNFDYTMEVKIPSPEALTIIDHFNAGASPFGMGMSLGGDYELDYGYVVDVNGYVYQKVAEGTALELCAGGIYKGTVTLPKAVSDHGEVLPVAGFGEKALYGEREVTDVTYYRDTQYVKPSAFYRSGMRYVWRTDYNLPKYIYPSEDFQSYIIQQELYDWDYNTPRWMFFKHNYAPLTFVKDQLKDESKKWGYSPFHAAGMQGIFFEMRVPDALSVLKFALLMSIGVSAPAASGANICKVSITPSGVLSMAAACTKLLSVMLTALPLDMTRRAAIRASKMMLSLFIYPPYRRDSSPKKHRTEKNSRHYAHKDKRGVHALYQHRLRVGRQPV